MVTALQNRLDLFRPYKPAGYDSETTYTKYVLSNVKLNQPSTGWTVGTDGSMQKKTATLFYNFGRSASSGSAPELFKAGDIICTPSQSVVPSADRFVVQAVTTHTFKGSEHHLEVVLV